VTITSASLILYAGAMGLLWLTPGPVWVAITARALSGGFASAWPLSLGVALGDLVWPLFAVFGLAWVVDQWSGFTDALRLVAVALFVGMGVLLIRHAADPISRDRRLTRPGRWAGFAAGVAAVFANPKAVLFYMGALPGFFDLRHVTAPDIAAIAAISMLVPLAGNLALGLAVGTARAKLATPERLRLINLISGGLLVAVGLVLLGLSIYA
jgi:threonine/homoserine/homoserine lactone efflux protein